LTKKQLTLPNDHHQYTTTYPIFRHISCGRVGTDSRVI
jgi:hypothetical protein